MDREVLYEYVKTIRRKLHRMPELEFDLPKTSAFIHQELLSLGYDPIPAARCGWIAVQHGRQEAAVAFRADMDALPVTEQTGIPFASNHPGRMHACGHDGHMALLLGFARELRSKGTPDQTVVLIFQPAEEGPGGAKIIMESGILKTLNVQRIYGFHLYPGLPEGKFGLAKGPFMARNGEFDIRIEGRSSHAGQPHLGIDALAAGAALVSDIQSIGSRNIDPLSPFVVNIGTFHSGEARNIVAGRADLTGTIRCYDKATYQTIRERLRAMAEGLSRSYGVGAALEIRDYYPEVYNDPELTGEIMSLLGEEEYEILQPLMLAEDFSFYQEQIPGVFVFLGTGSEEKGFVHSLHSASFNFDERVLLMGIDLYFKLLGPIGD